MVNGGHVYIDCIHGTSTSWPTILAAVYFEIMNFNDDDDDNDNNIIIIIIMIFALCF